MPSSKIFLVNENEKTLSVMKETSYDQEFILQQLIAQYPDLLPGDQINPDAPRKWLFIARELSIPGGEDETGRWKLDHLYLDQDGIPTFVECKRSSDTRTRREVVAQMLDYAANGTEYLSMDKIREAAATTAALLETNLDALVLDLLDVGDDEVQIDDFWQRVESNLRESRVRLIFAVDRAPKELRRLVEFLNEKMADVEVLIVEVKQYIGETGQKAIVPRVIGLTEAVRATKPGGSKGKTNRREFLSNCSTTQIAEFFEYVLDEAGRKGHEIYWGSVGFSIRAYLPEIDQKASFVYGYPPQTFQFFFGHLRVDRIDLTELREELLSYGIFRESGAKTLTANLSEIDLTQARKVYDFILDNIDRYQE